LIVCVSHDNHMAAAFGLPPLVRPYIRDVVKVNIT
jgi:hypothetical protein